MGMKRPRKPVHTAVMPGTTHPCIFNKQWGLSGSTSTALQHIKTTHYEKITPDETCRLNKFDEPTPYD